MVLARLSVHAKREFVLDMVRADGINTPQAYKFAIFDLRFTIFGFGPTIVPWAK
jgi:hypothetical protein